MSFLNTIKRAAAGTAHAITGDKPKMQSAIEQPDSNPLPKKLPDWDLPELDPEDPDYEAKLSDHNAIRALEKHFNDNLPGLDFSDYQRKIAEWQKQAPEKRSMNPFVKLGIALGTQDPNNIYAENKTLKGISERENSEHASEMSEFEKTLDMKKEAMTGHIKQLLSQGEFRKALAMATTKSQNDITQERIKAERDHTNKMDEIKATGDERDRVAQTNARARIESAGRRTANALEIATSRRMKEHDSISYRNAAKASEAKFKQDIGIDSNNSEPRYPHLVEGAYDAHQARLRQLDDDYDDKDGDGILDKDDPTPNGSGGTTTDAGASASGTVQLQKNGQNYGAPISRAEFDKRGGEKAAKAHGYTVK